MHQEDFFRPKRFQYDGKLTDFHPSNNGACKSLLFSDELNGKYVGKTKTADHRFIIINEYLSSKLLTLLNIPTPPAHLFNKNGESIFLSKYSDNAKKLLNYSPDKLSGLVSNTLDLIGILCFDVWVMNYDRHCNNLIIADKKLIAIDHDRALFNQSKDESKLILRDQADPIHFYHRDIHPYLAHFITSFTQVQPYIDRIKSITDAQIYEVVHGDDLTDMDEVQKSLLYKTLIERKVNIEELIKRIFRRSTLFPNMTIVIS